MNFKIVNENLDNINKILIIYKCFEVFEKSYKDQILSNKIVKYPADIQIKLTKLNTWWLKKKNDGIFNPEEDKLALSRLLELWAYI